MATYGGSNDSMDTNHCDSCFIFNKIKVDSSSMCRECRHQLCDTCVEHHRRTLATQHHNIISFQQTDTLTTQVLEQQPKHADQSGTKSKQDFRTTVRKSHVGTRKQPITAVGQAQRNARVNTADAHSYISSTQHQSETPQYEVSGRRVTDSDGVDQDQAVTRSINNTELNMGSDSIDQDQTVAGSMKNMRLNAGTSNIQTTRQTGKPYTTVTLKHSLDVKRENDVYRCYITGLVVLQDKLIVCDSSNDKLKVYDWSYRFLFWRTYRFLYEYKCDNEPYDIDMLDFNTVVVSSEDGHNMRLLSVGNDSMKEISKINTEYECKGVCCYEGKIYCVVGSQVRVYLPGGQLLHKFEHLSDGKVECNHLQYITVNPQTGILYVTDRDKDVVLALSTSGDVIAVMSPPQLESPRGIAVNDHGHIYVCGVNSHKVIQMSEDGQNVVEILSGEDKYKLPHCVKIYGNKMFVSHKDPDSRNDKVSIYQLS